MAGERAQRVRALTASTDKSSRHHSQTPNTRLQTKFPASIGAQMQVKRGGEEGTIPFGDQRTTFTVFSCPSKVARNTILWLAAKMLVPRLDAALDEAEEAAAAGAEGAGAELFAEEGAEVEGAGAGASGRTSCQICIIHRM